MQSKKQNKREDEITHKLLKPSRKFEIKNPRLQAIRYNLRTIIKFAVSDEISRINKMDDIYQDKFDELLKRGAIKRVEEASTLSKRSNQLIRQKRFIMETFRNSICVPFHENKIRNANIDGDRMRVTEISVWDHPLKEVGGAHYVAMKRFYSVEEYNRFAKSFEKNFKVLSKEALVKPNDLVSFNEFYRIA